MHDIVGLFQIHETAWHFAWLGSCVIYLKNMFDPLAIPFVKDYDSSICFDCIMFEAC
jgi:hypothetical protein